MKYLIFSFLLAVLLTGCSVLGPGAYDFSVDVVDLENVSGGVRITFRVDSDGEDVYVAGAAYGRDSLFSLTKFQASATLLPSGLFEVILPTPDDGPGYFQAYAGFDGFYALSDVVPFNVTSAGVATGCAPTVNALGGNMVTCSADETNVYTRTVNDDQFEVRLTCYFGQSSELTLTFPRDPTSGVYRTTRSIWAASPRDKVVQGSLLVGSQHCALSEWQEIYVNRSEDYTDITLCEITFPIVGTTRNVTTTVRFPR